MAMTPINDLAALDTTLQKEGGASIFTAHGLLSALNCYPCVLPIEDWLPIIWGEERSFSNWQELAELFAALGKLNQTVAANLQNHALLPLVDYQATSAFNYAQLTEEQREYFLQWCVGFTQGLACGMPFWTEEGNEEVLGAIVAIGTLAEQSADLIDYDDDEEEDLLEEDEDADEEDWADEIFDDEEYDEEEDEEEDDIDDFDEMDVDEIDEDAWSVTLSDEEIADMAKDIVTQIKALYQYGHAATNALEKV